MCEDSTSFEFLRICSPTYLPYYSRSILPFRVKASFLKNLKISYEIAIIWMLVE